MIVIIPSLPLFILLYLLLSATINPHISLVTPRMYQHCTDVNCDYPVNLKLN